MWIRLRIRGVQYNHESTHSKQLPFKLPSKVERSKKCYKNRFTLNRQDKYERELDRTICRRRASKDRHRIRNEGRELKYADTF